MKKLEELPNIVIVRLKNYFSPDALDTTHFRRISVTIKISFGGDEREGAAGGEFWLRVRIGDWRKSKTVFDSMMTEGVRAWARSAFSILTPYPLLCLSVTICVASLYPDDRLVLLIC